MSTFFWMGFLYLRVFAHWYFHAFGWLMFTILFSLAAPAFRSRTLFKMAIVYCLFGIGLIYVDTLK